MYVTLRSSDDVDFRVHRNAAERMSLIEEQIKYAIETDTPIRISSVTFPILAKVIEYCEYHSKDPFPDSTEYDYPRRKPDIDEWDMDYMRVEQDLVFEIILAANSLDIKPLVDLCAKTIANMIRAKSPEEIRRLFNITNDFTPEEEARIRMENEWAEDS